MGHRVEPSACSAASWGRCGGESAFSGGFRIATPRDVRGPGAHGRRRGILRFILAQLGRSYYGSGRSRMSFRPAFWRGGIQPTSPISVSNVQAEGHQWVWVAVLTPRLPRPRPSAPPQRPEGWQSTPRACRSVHNHPSPGSRDPGVSPETITDQPCTHVICYYHSCHFKYAPLTLRRECIYNVLCRPEDPLTHLAADDVGEHGRAASARARPGRPMGHPHRV